MGHKMNDLQEFGDSRRHTHRTTGPRPFTGIPSPYGVRTLDLEDFRSLFHNFQVPIRNDNEDLFECLSPRF